MIDPKILEWATDVERKYIEALLDIGTKEGTARRFQVHPKTIYNAIRRCEQRAAKGGWTPATDNSKFVAEGYSIKGTSSFTDGDGKVLRQWVKTEKEKQEQEAAIRAFVEGLCEDIPRAKPRVSSKARKDNLMNGIFIGDAHFGMYAYAPETKDSDYDTDIATQVHIEAIDHLVDQAVEAEMGLLVNVGDLIHTNTSHNQTYSGTPLDVDTRLHRVVKAAAGMMIYAVNKMLTKHNKVIVVNAKGNHDTDSVLGVQIPLYYKYENEPRVTVLESNTAYHFIEWGNWLIGVNHGDKMKPEKLVEVMAHDVPRAWGRTTHRMWATGHLHHKRVLSVGGCTVEVFAALPPRDAWHGSKGYGSERLMEMITFKKEGGRMGRAEYELDRPVIEPDYSENG